jgi:hypothetical protein
MGFLPAFVRPASTASAGWGRVSMMAGCDRNQSALSELVVFRCPEGRSDDSRSVFCLQFFAAGGCFGVGIRIPFD